MRGNESETAGLSTQMAALCSDVVLWVCSLVAPKRGSGNTVDGAPGRPSYARVVATNLGMQVSTDELRRLAEVFEAREFILSHGDTRGWERAWGVSVDALAERLYAAGWRPGDSTERAAELLAAQETR